MATRSSGRSKPAAMPALDASQRVVVLRGPDAYLRRSHTQRLEAALRAVHGEIARFDFDGRSVDPVLVLDELRTYGLLQDHKLVVVDHAEQMLARAGSPTPRESFEGYATNPVETATLVLRAETWRPGKLDKRVEAVGAIVKCDPPDAATAIKWCTARSDRAHGAAIQPAAATRLVERIGPSLDRLDVELAKLAAAVEPGQAITAEDVMRHVGLGREEKAWRIQSEVLTGDPGRAIAVLRELLEVSGQPEQLVLWSLTDLAKKLHAASRLLAAGRTPGTVRKELRLFGDAAGPILQRAARLSPEAAADLLAAALDADRRTKRGIGRVDRTVETLVATFADTAG